jgi:hypothetical protein
VEPEAVSSFFSIYKRSHEGESHLKQPQAKASVQSRADKKHFVPAVTMSSCGIIAPERSPQIAEAGNVSSIAAAEAIEIAEALDEGELPENLRRLLEDIKRLEECSTRTAGTQDVLKGKGRKGRKVAGVLMEVRSGTYFSLPSSYLVSSRQ